MKQAIMILIIAALGVKTIVDYMNLPRVGINQAGLCQWVEVKGKIYRPCNGMMPIGKYVKVHVKGWEK